jgi:sporulation protein YlmC with PRC-barrel domain
MREPLLASADLHGLPVYDVDAVPIGEIFGVLAEAESGLVRFFDVALEGRRRHVLVPVGHGRVEPHLGKSRLRLRAATARELDRIPAYEPHTSWHDDVFQNELLTAFGRLFDGQRYYAHPAYDHSGLYAGAHPLLRDPLSPVTPAGLRRLSASPGFSVPESEPDIRSWEVCGENNVRLGRVTDLVIDAQAEEVRYIAMRREVDERETAIPIGYCELAQHAVHVPMSSEEVCALPEFAGAELSRPEEARLRTILDDLMTGARRYLRPDFRSVV